MCVYDYMYFWHEFNVIFQRYLIASDGHILLSIQGNRNGKLQPRPNQDFRTVGDDTDAFYYAYILKRKFNERTYHATSS